MTEMNSKQSTSQVIKEDWEQNPDKYAEEGLKVLRARETILINTLEKEDKLSKKYEIVSSEKSKALDALSVEADSKKISSQERDELRRRFKKLSKKSSKLRDELDESSRSKFRAQLVLKQFKFELQSIFFNMPLTNKNKYPPRYAVIPEHFLCPLSQVIIQNPVYINNDQQSYELIL